MKFSINRVQLLNALNVVSRAVNSKNPNVTLTGIKLELNDLGLTLTGTDSNIAICTFIPLTSNNETNITLFEPGETILSAKYITDIVRKLDSDLIELDLVENTLMKIRDTNSDFSLNTMSTIDYPTVDFSASGSSFIIPGITLKLIIEQTAFAASDKEARPILTGVNFSCNNNVLSCVATDGYRLAKKIVNVENTSDFNVTIPAKTLIEIGRLLENEKEVEIKVSSNKIVFNLNNIKMSARLINAAYPNTSKLVADSFLYTLDTLSSAMVSAIDRASLVSPEKSNFVKLSVSNENLIISSRSNEIGSVIERINNFSYQGNRLDISFTAKYVIDAIRALGCDEITFLFNGDTKSFVVKSNKDESIIQLIQPVRTA